MLKDPYVQALLVGTLATGTLYAYHRYIDSLQDNEEYLKTFGIITGVGLLLAVANKSGGGSKLLSGGGKKAKDILTEPFSV